MHQERIAPSPFIKFIWSSTATESGSFTDVAHDFWVLVFRLAPRGTEVILTGPITQPEPITYTAGQTNWGIVLESHVFIADLPKKSMLNMRTHLLVDGNEFWLGKHKLRIPTYHNAEAFIEDLVRRGILTASPVIAKALQGRAPAMSTRNLQRHYASTTGITQGQLQQIQRARQAFVLLEQGKTIAQAAAQAGYADQAHMTRSLKVLIGQTPGQIIKDYLAG